MFKIFADSHKIVSTKIYDNIYDIYGVKLNKDKLLWGSVSPDLLPQYKFIRHYKDESLNFIVKEIMRVIFIGRFLDFNKVLDPLTINIISKKIGVISHYLSDYVCLPHAKRWTFVDSMVKHIKYESKLNEYAYNHDFNINIIDSDVIDFYDSNIFDIKEKVKNYINNVVEEYSLKEGYKNDLDFALSLNLNITHFIIDTIEVHSEDTLGKLALAL